MTIFELMTQLSAFDADSIDMAAKATVQAGIPGAKDIYMAWGKEKGIAAKALEAAYKEAQPEKTSGGPRGFAEMYYDWLAEASRSEQEAHDYIMSNESQNVRNHLTHYLNIWALAETVRRGEKVVRKQAMLPQGATVLDNPIGTACGFKLKINNAVCYFTPGVPNEFKQMVQQQIIPDLQQLFPSGAAVVRRYFTFGISESSLSDMLDNMNWPPHIELGYRSSMPTIEMKLISQHANADFDSAEKQLLSVIAPYLVASAELDMPKQLKGLLNNTHLEILEGSTCGELLTQLAPAIPDLCADYHTHLPDQADDLLQHIQHHSRLTSAVGTAKDQHYPIALWNGIHGWAQTLYVRTLDVTR